MTQTLFGKNPIKEVLLAKRRKVFEISLLEKKGHSADRELAEFVQHHFGRFHLKSRQDLDRQAQTTFHQGVTAQVENFPYASLEELTRLPEPSLIIAGDSLQDPQNLGSICRALVCFGGKGLLLPKNNSVEITPTVCKASAGAVEHLKVAKVNNLSRSLDELKEAGYWVYGTQAQAKLQAHEVNFPPKTVVVLGSEGKGVREGIQKHCDEFVSIPMRGEFDSLNVAQAAAILSYEVSRQQKGN